MGPFFSINKYYYILTYATKWHKVDHIATKGSPMHIGYHSITWGGVVGAPSGVTSVKDLYYKANGSMDLALKDIAQAGYEGVELFDGNLMEESQNPSHWEEILASTKLQLVSVYSGANFIYADILPDELARIEHAAKLSAQFGASRLVVGGGARRAAGTSPEDYQRLTKALDKVVDIADRFGIGASYHPHLGTIVENPQEIDRVMSNSRISFCPDTAHLAAGGGNPAELIRNYGNRVAHIHLKDLNPDPLKFLPLGQGTLDFSEILKAIHEINYDDWLMVELDYYDGDPAQAAQISKAFLDKLMSVSKS